MDWNKKLIFIILLLASTFSLSAQRLETGINIVPGLFHSQGFEPGMNGEGISINYLHPLNKDWMLQGGIEAGITGWGTQTLLLTGVRWKNQLEFNLLNGLALYQQAPNYVFGTELMYVQPFFPTKRNQLLLSIGLRYTLQPADKTYSPIYSYIDIPIKIRWGIDLKKKK